MKNAHNTPKVQALTSKINELRDKIDASTNKEEFEILFDQKDALVSERQKIWDKANGYKPNNTPYLPFCQLNF